MDKKRPIKVKGLKIIDHIGSLYATFNGSAMWEVDKVAYAILKMCDGTKTIDEITKDISKKTGVDEKDVKITLTDILKEMEKLNFIEYV
jgi:hypothetical protein